MVKYKKKPKTPKRKIQNAIMKVWFHSRERNESLKVHGEYCVECGDPFKQVHHVKPINWQRIYDVIYEEVLNLNTIPLCAECHNKHKPIRKK